VLELHKSQLNTNTVITLLKRQLNFINYTFSYFYRFYGTYNTIKGILFFNYRKIKELSFNIHKEHTLEINGYKLSTIPNDIGISSELLTFKTHEPLSTILLKETIDKGMTCLDIGANIGYYALLEKKLVGETGQVIAVEPSPINFNYLKKNFKINSSGFDNFELHNFAFSSNDGETNFLVNERSNLSKIAEKSQYSGIREIIKIPKRSLDSFITEKGIEKIDLIRMDVEGHENEILSGAILVIKKHRPLLYIETHKGLLGLEKTIEFLKFLQNMGYESKYFIAREMDLPLIGTRKDIKKTSIAELLERLSNDMLPNCFHLLLENKTKIERTPEIETPFMVADLSGDSIIIKN
jgi:FkbM family methyltransferase